MTLPINSLANMEYMLYGGALGANPNCPSYANGYKAVNNNYYNPYMQQYQNGTSYVPSSNIGINPQAIQNSYNNTPQLRQGYPKQAVSKNDINTLAKFYEDANTYVQKWGDIGTSALMIGMMENSQVIKHPLNSFRAMGVTNKIFDKSNPAVQALWKKNPE